MWDPKEAGSTASCVPWAHCTPSCGTQTPGTPSPGLPSPLLPARCGRWEALAERTGVRYLSPWLSSLAQHC